MFAQQKGILTLIVVAAITHATFGQGVGTGSPTDTTLSLTHWPQIPEEPWIWGASMGYGSWIPVSLDPEGTAWGVHLLAPASGVVTGNHIVLAQYLTIGGHMPWTGWQMDLDTPSMEWVSGHTGSIGETPRILVDGAAPPGLTAALTADSIRFSFDPLPPGAQLTIVNEMIYTPTETDPFRDTVDIRQFPVPEPTTVVLMAIAGAVLSCYRR